MQQATKSPVGVIGLGLLGTALADRLIEGGFPTFVHNRSVEKAEPLLAKGAVWSDNPFVECDKVVVCLYRTETVEEVLRTMAPAFRDGHAVVDTTTGDPQQTASLGRWLADRGVDYLEAPIAASSEQTRRGHALAIVAGEQRVFDNCSEVLQCIAPASFYVGPWGCAAKTKLVNNLILGLTRAAIAEGLVLAKHIGLDLNQTLEVVKRGSAYSVVMDVKGRKMIEGDFTAEAKLSQHLKDVRLILEEGRRCGLELPLSLLHEQLLEEGEADGLGDLDNCAIIRTIEAHTATPTDAA